MDSSGDGVPDSTQPRRPVPFVARIVIDIALAGQLLAAAAFWWLTPKGFPFSHSRFWLNSVIPIIAIAVVTMGIWGLLRERYRLTGLGLFFCAVVWSAIAIAGRVFFPLSLRGVWLAVLLSVALAIVGYFVVRRRAALSDFNSLPVSILGVLIGVFIAWAQVPPAPTTQPLGQIEELTFRDETETPIAPLVPLGENAQFHSATGDLSIKYNDVTIRCAPLLTFDRISPDGFWSILAPKTQNNRRARRQQSDSDSFDFEYSDDSAIRILRPTDSSQIELSAYSVVERDTFSHLNSFCVLDITGHAKLSLRFSPCNETTIDVLPADYPTGRPARFAYLDAQGIFSVVEATSGEKGPFRKLASGPLLRGDPLTITFCNEGQPFASVTLEDWTAQLSSALSPTAGWGVPMNAIEFQRLGSAEDAPATIWITLAATSVGRGWETVGHRSGIYRNRLVFRAEPDE